MAIRILHVLDTLETGGTESGVVRLIQQMDSRRFEHVVCTIRRLGILADRLPREARVFCLEAKPGFSLQVAALARRIRETGANIVHARNWGTAEAILAGRCARRCALVYSEHGLESGVLGPEPFPRRALRRLVFQMSDRVFSVSRQLRDHHARMTGFPANRIDVIHNGIEVERFRPSAESRAMARRQLGIGPLEFCIGAVGRLEAVKNTITVLRAVAALPPSANWRLLIAGEGRESGQLREFAASQPSLAGRVGFLGEIQDVHHLFNALDSYVLASVYEGISNSLLEAMATGLPVIASAVGGNPEVVKDEESGLLFPPGDEEALRARLLRVAGDPDLRRRLGESAMRRVTGEFSSGGMVRRYEQLYDSLANPAGAIGTSASVHRTSS